MLKVEGYLWGQEIGVVDWSNLDKLLIYILFDPILNLPFYREKVARGVPREFERKKMLNKDINWKSEKASKNHHYLRPIFAQKTHESNLLKGTKR